MATCEQVIHDLRRDDDPSAEAERRKFALRTRSDAVVREMPRISAACPTDIVLRAVVGSAASIVATFIVDLWPSTGH